MNIDKLYHAILFLCSPRERVIRGLD